MIFCGEGAAGARKAGARQSAQGAQMRFKRKKRRNGNIWAWTRRRLPKSGRAPLRAKFPREIVEQRIDGARLLFVARLFVGERAHVSSAGRADAAFDAADKDGAFIARSMPFMAAGKISNIFSENARSD